MQTENIFNKSLQISVAVEGRSDGYHPMNFDDIIESRDSGFLTLSAAGSSPRRRVLYVNSYGGEALWKKIKQGLIPSHHLWGCLELVRMGYQVAIPDPLPDFYFHKNPLPHDMRLFKCVRSWLGNDGIVYCGHNVLYWIPLLRYLRILRCQTVSYLWAKEPLNVSWWHTGIITLTQAGTDQAKKLAPRAKIAQLGWGFDLSYFPSLPYDPEWFLSCGKTMRDFKTLRDAAAECSQNIYVIFPRNPEDISWSSNVTLFDEGRKRILDDTGLTYNQLMNEYYSKAAGSLIILKNDPWQKTAVGVTNLIEAMAMSRPVIVTKTGALPTEIDVEETGCGLHVPPDNPGALADAIKYLSDNPDVAKEMGEAGRKLTECRYNSNRFALDLHAFFEEL